jgi:hypothetical protein
MWNDIEQHLSHVARNLSNKNNNDSDVNNGK